MEDNPKGFHITCRQDQFARFIIYRYHANECINGVKDLQPNIILQDMVPRRQLVSEKIADDLRNITQGDVLAVMQCLNCRDEMLDVEGLVDVSGNFHNG